MINTPIQPAMSVILITPDTYDTIKRVVSYLQAQTVKEQLELILVGTTRDRMHIKEEEFASFDRYQILEVGEWTVNAKARAVGVRAAHAPVVSFLEDHTFPAYDWAEHLIQEHQKEWAGVGSEILNANPESLTSWANLYLAHGRWVGAQLGGIRNHLPWHSTAYKRDLLLEYGDALEMWLEAEGLMQDDLRCKGHQFYLKNQAKIKHLNISSLRAFTAKQYTGGRVFGAVRCANWSWWQRALYIGGSPLIPFRRLPQLLTMIRLSGWWQHLMPRILLPLLFGLSLHSFGEMMGYAFGIGRARERSTHLEFHHDRHLCACDQDWETRIEWK